MKIDPANVYYINADDTYRGIVEKQRIAEAFGFKLLVPGLNGFKAEMLTPILRHRAATDTARGTVVILDTLKKFTDLMHKANASAFGDVVRLFTANGGTMIALAHVNKHKSLEGESVYSGTTDIIDDADCAYVLDLVEDNGTTRVVKFRNLKDRGDVRQVATFTYASKMQRTDIEYRDLFDSVAELSFEQAKEAEQRAAVAERLAVNHDAINAVLDALGNDVTIKSELVAELMQRTAISRKKAIQVIDAHTGTNRLAGHRWNYRKGEKNAQVFFKL